MRRKCAICGHLATKLAGDFTWCINIHCEFHDRPMCIALWNLTQDAITNLRNGQKWSDIFGRYIKEASDENLKNV
jgi:hypothetical protein